MTDRARIITPVSIAVIGAITAGLLYFLQAQEAMEIRRFPVNTALVVVFVSAFVSCFFALKMFFSVIKNKRWQYAFLYGPWFCGLAGAAAGGVTSISIILSGADNILSGSPAMGIAVAGSGLWLGFLVGAVAGFIFGPVLTILMSSNSPQK